MTKKQDLGDRVYGGAASFGKMIAIFGVIIGTLVGVLLIVGGVIFIFKKKIRNQPVTGFIKSLPMCDSTSNKKTITYHCKFMVDYTIDEKDYSHTFHTNSSTNYTGDQQVVLYYDKATPSDVTLVKDDPHTQGKIMVGFGVVILLIVWIKLWLVMKYEFAAAASGVGGAWSLIR